MTIEVLIIAQKENSKLRDMIKEYGNQGMAGTTAAKRLRSDRYLARRKQNLEILAFGSKRLEEQDKI
jgi:hypothetical protein